MLKSNSGNEKGIALIFALLLAVIIVGGLTVGAQLIVTSLRESHKQKAIYAQAEAIAKAGVTDALSWFRRQQSQPVRSGYPVPGGTYPDAAFYPRQDTDTIEESIGLVKEELMISDPPVYGRYEVKRQSVDNYVNPSLTDPDAVHDITGQKLQGRYAGEGLIWSIESKGYVFVKRDPAKEYNESPNEILGRATISTEFRRITIQLPTNSAVFIDYGGPSTENERRLRIFSGAKLKGGTGNYGSTRRTGYGAYVQSGGYVSSQYNFNTTTLVLDSERIFGVSASELKLMSDYLVSNVSKLPYSAAKELPSIGIYYIDGNATFNSNYPLNTSGILFVNGNLTINSYSPGVYFTGIIYVNNGQVTIYGPALISGALVCNNYPGQQYVYIYGSTGIAEIDYDPDIINSVRQQLTQYRENKAMYRVHSVLK